MSRGLEIFAKAGEIIRGANALVLGKERLGADDARNYLQSLSEADKILTGSFRTKTVDALNQWGVNRSWALFELLYEARSSSQQGRLDTAEACVRCSLTLVEEPLIVSRDRGEYVKTVMLFNQVLRQSRKDRSKLTPVYEVLALGVVYNAEKFCPEVFQDPITEDLIIQDQQRFSRALEELRGDSTSTVQ